MRLSSRTALAGSLLAVTLLASGCSGSSGTANGDSGHPRTGGTLRIGLDYDPVCLDPQQSALGQSLDVGRQLVDSLTDQDPRDGKTVPWLATRWKADPEATRFTFTLRAGATFSDGTPVDAPAVKANFDAVHELGAAASRGAVYLDGYRETRVSGARTLTVVFDKPNAQFLRGTSTVSLGLLSPGSLRRTPQERCTGHLVGSGPFVLDRYRPNTSVTLDRRKGYSWGSRLWQREGGAYLEGVEYRIVPENTTRSGALSAGQLDVATALAPQDRERFSAPGWSLLTRTAPGVDLSLYVNTRRTALREAAVRQALQKGIDREAVATTFLSSRKLAATSVLSSTTPGYTDLGDRLAHDPAGARRLLDKAGWRPGADGIRVKNGVRLRLDAVFVRQQSLELVQQQLKDIGVELRLRQLTVSRFPEVLAAGSYDLSLQSANRADPDILTTAFAGGTPVADARLRSELRRATSSTDEATRSSLFAAAQRRLVDEGHVLPLNETEETAALSTRVHGLTRDASNRLVLHDTWTTG
ncbi:ABC transporter substrate-binding protein [Streptomyces sp. AM 3-1-1]|uniref:ABC transporter substrate-binding protein n=1 Tax=Streptomyces sp. AM 3-1-1 TaxID=3028711 RepID=UPI0023BA1675|nr:ABC transporter substrate-binding protein [Streptomyces sp. AM 3-1-1]WEH30861.1 ABC transporter substrate-binding protein [Streptomyces sp. AM 3-1-1]